MLANLLSVFMAHMIICGRIGEGLDQFVELLDRNCPKMSEAGIDTCVFLLLYL